MVQFRKNHPWNPGYALPAHVLAEPPGRGTIQGKYIPRRTYNPIPEGWTGGYALPAYVMAENHGKGAAGSYGIRRRTVSRKYQTPLGYVGYPDAPLALRLPAEVYALDGTHEGPSKIPASDPVKKLGVKISKIIVSELTKLPPSMRNSEMRKLFAAIDPKLNARVGKRTAKNRARGMSAADAFRAALASSVSEGFIDQMVSLGKGAKPTHALSGGLGGAWSTLKSWGSTALSKVKDASCAVVSSDVGKTSIVIGAGTVGTVYGTPAAGALSASAAQAGVTLADSKCNPPKPDTGILPGILPPSIGQSPWLLPAAVGGGVLLLALAVAPRKVKKS